MTYSVTFSQQVSTDEAQHPPGVRALITIQSVTGFQDKALFVFQSVDGLLTFQYVAKPPDLVNFQTGIPDQVTRFVRAESLTVTVADSAALDDLQSIIQADLQNLCTVMKRLNTYSQPVVVTVQES